MSLNMSLEAPKETTEWDDTLRKYAACYFDPLNLMAFSDLVYCLHFPHSPSKSFQFMMFETALPARLNWAMQTH